jgi:hypothetical protein
MLSLGASAMYLAARKHQSGNFVGGILTIYLVTTAWVDRPGQEAKNQQIGLGCDPGSSGNRGEHSDQRDTEDD